MPAVIRKRLIGLTGGIGSGKSTVAQLLVGQGAHIVDADQVSRSLTASGGRAMDAIRLAFGDRVIDATGALDRDAMRKLAFDRPEARRQLEQIIHPLVGQVMREAVAAAPFGCVVLDIPLLAESDRWRQQLEAIVVVDCAETTQVQRVCARNGLAPDTVEAIMRAQAPRALRLSVADYVVYNDGISLDTLALTVRGLAARLGL